MKERVFQLKTVAISDIQTVVSVAKALMANYQLEFDNKEDLFGCENGVIDFEEECFRYYRFDDYITFSCGYDFVPCILGLKIQTGVEEVTEGDKKVSKPIYRRLTEEGNPHEFQASLIYLMDIYTQIFPDEELRNYFFKILSTGGCRVEPSKSSLCLMGLVGTAKV